MNDRALAKTQGSELATVESRPSTMLQFTPEQSQIIRDMCANGASESEFAFLMEIAKARGLNPLLKQIHFVKRWDGQKKRDVWAAQVGIDGFRSIANKTGYYDGQDEPEYGPLNDKGFPQWAKVRVWRKGVSRPFVGLAYWAEFVQTKSDGHPTRFWQEMPLNQLAKCAESLGLRKAFPEELGGLYSPEEMGQAENDRHQLNPAQNISPHGQPDDYPEPESTEAYDLIAGKLATIRNGLDTCDSHRKAAALRAELGSKAAPQAARLTRDMQAARDGNLVGFDGLKELAKRWNYCDRQLAKLEAQYPAPPPVELEDKPEGELMDPAEEFQIDPSGL
jgi:phage recombination protein Bet